MTDVDLIRSLLDWAPPLPHIRALTSVTSTSDIAWAWADAGCPEWTVVLAEEQVRGRGRFGRTWHSPRGAGLLMSVVLHPPVDAIGSAHLTALGALAAAEAVEQFGPLARIQWPNDVVVGDRKIAGVLVERRGSAAACVLGVGLNVSTPRDGFPPALRDSATSLAAETGDAPEVEPVAAALLGRLRTHYLAALEGAWPDVADAWRARSVLQDGHVTLTYIDQTFHGRVLAVDPLDGIRLALDSGEERAFLAERATLHTDPTHSCT
jgi:BirA family biotin operon repressor/biotin-[acetyl-CoA-carboxylase] ligase